MKSLGGVLFLGVTPAASAAASSTESTERPESEFSIVDDQVVVNKDVSGEDGESSQTADVINTGIENGYLNVFEKNGEVMVESAVSSNDNTPIIPHVTMSSGYNDLSWDQNTFSTSITLRMDDDLTYDVVIALSGAAAVSAATAAVLGTTGIGAVPAAIAGVISAALGFFAAVLATRNEGSGVIIKFTHRRLGLGYGTVSAQ